MSKPVLLSGGNGKAKELAGTANGQLLVNNGSNEVVFSSPTVPTAGQVPVWSGSAWAPGTISPGGGGGGGLTYLLNYSVAGASPTPSGTWKQLSLTPTTSAYNTGGGAVTAPNGGTYANLADFVTPLTEPGATTTPPGFWDLNVYLTSNGAADETLFRFSVHKWDGTTLSAAIATSAAVGIDNPATVTLYTASVFVPSTVLSATERIAIKVEVTRTTSNAHTVTGYFEGVYYTHMHTTLGAPGSTGLVKVVNGIIQAPATLLVNADVSNTAAISVSKISGAAPLASPAFTGTVTIGTLSGLLRATAGVIAGSATVALGSEVTGTLPVGNGGTGATTLTGYVKGNGASAMTASLTIPTSDLFGNIALGSQVSGTLPIANGGTNNASLVVTQGTVYYGDGSKLLGLAPGTPGQVLQSQGSAAPQWAGVPYDLSAASAGTYSNSQVIFRYIAPRAVTITSTGSYFKCVTASSGTVTAAVAQSGSASTSFNVTFSVAGGTTGSVPTGTTIAMAVGDILTVTMPASANSSLAGVYFTLKGTGV